jgi:hypothetical protein
MTLSHQSRNWALTLGAFLVWLPLGCGPATTSDPLTLPATGGLKNLQVGAACDLANDRCAVGFTCCKPDGAQAASCIDERSGAQCGS